MPVMMRGSVPMVQGLLELIDFIPEPERKTMVEIGCYSGESTMLFASRFHVVYAVDPWVAWPAISSDEMNEIEALFDLRLKGFPSVRKVKRRSLDVAHEFFDLDFVYFDANHDFAFVCDDIRAWFPRIGPYGWIGGHDYVVADYSEVVQAVAATLKGEVKVFSDNSWLIRKSDCQLL